MLHLLKSMSRSQKQFLLLVIDVLVIPLALYGALVMQMNTAWPALAVQEIGLFLPYLMLSGAALSWFLGTPQIRLNAYEIRAVGRTAAYATYLMLAAAILARIAALEFGMGLWAVFGLLVFLLSVASRVLMLQLVLAIYRRNQPRLRVLIYGAGNTGLQLAHAFMSHESIEPVAFVDDNTSLQGVSLAGLPVFAPPKIAEFAKKEGISRVLLAMPAISQIRRAQITHSLQSLGLEVQALPSFAQLIGEEALIDKLAPVMPGQFLGRAHLDREIAGGAEIYEGRSILVTGAGGSIGSEICRQLLQLRPRRLVLFELSELALYTIEMELRQLLEGRDNPVEIIPLMGTITEARLVRRALTEHQVEVVLHTAAYKHVPMVEANALVGLSNNVLGTQILARESLAAGVARFILISSDKAVRPTNVMGASKRLAEMVVQDLASRAETTIFSMVRFGNVLGSSGSVVPLFQEQIARGGPVTLTDNAVTRYFMTLQEAVGLVILAGSYAEGSEIFVLDMGRPVPIRQLAEQMIEAAGYTLRSAESPEGDIEIKVTGLRPGEKLHEELTITKGRISTENAKIFCAAEKPLSEIEVAAAIHALREAVATGDEAAARAVITRWVEGYVPTGIAAGRG